MPATTFTADAAQLHAAEAHWEQNSDRTDEVKAAREGREITEADEQAWRDANTAFQEKLEAFLARRPATIRELADKARALTALGSDGRFRVEEEMTEVYIADAMHLAGLAVQEPAVQGWNAAVAALRSIEAVCRTEDELWRQLQADLAALAPAELVQDGRLRWCSVLNFDSISDPADADLRPMVEAFFARENVQALRAALNEQGDACDRADDAMCDAERLVMQTPAPDLMSVRWKMERFGRESAGGEGYADPLKVAALADGSRARSWPLYIYQDVLRLTGGDGPALKPPGFGPAKWMEDFNAVGGKAWIDYPKGMPELAVSIPADPGLDPRAVELRDALALGSNAAIVTNWLMEFA